MRITRSDLEAFLAEGRRLTKKSPRRVAFDDAAGAASRALRGRTSDAAVLALRSLSDAALALADELSGEQS